jgi:hypothetical protein
MRSLQASDLEDDPTQPAANSHELSQLSAVFFTRPDCHCNKDKTPGTNPITPQETIGQIIDT